MKTWTAGFTVLVLVAIPIGVGALCAALASSLIYEIWPDGRSGIAGVLIALVLVPYFIGQTLSVLRRHLNEEAK